MFNWSSQPNIVANGIMVFDDWIQNTKDIIDLGESDPRWRSGQVSCTCGEDHEDSSRVTDVLDLVPSIDEDALFFYIAKGLKSMGDFYAHTYDTTYENMEIPQMLRYSAGHGQYGIHCDAGKSLPRAFSAVLYLNTVDEGGETEFPDLGVKISPVAGRLAIFPANFMYKHRANVPISNDKYSIVTWYKYV